MRRYIPGTVGAFVGLLMLGLVSVAPTYAQRAPTFTGPVPAPGTIGLLVTTAVTDAPTLIVDLSAGGCQPALLAVLTSGDWLLYVNGGPAFVNAAFPSQLAAGIGFFVRCSSTPPSITPGATATPIATATPTPTPVVGGGATFGDGTYVVGIQMPAGRYRVTSVKAGCSWSRRGASGAVVASAQPIGTSALVDVASTDQSFTTTGCGAWSRQLGTATSSTASPIVEGQFIVGVDVRAGLWRTLGGASCRWERLTSFSGEASAVVASGQPTSTTTVTIEAGDVGFAIRGGCSWISVG